MKSEFVSRIAVTISVICVTLVTATVGALAMSAVRARLGLAPAEAPSYAVGASIDIPSSVYDASSYTAVLFARSDCGACQAARPWLTALVSAMQAQPSTRVVMIATGTNLSDDVGYGAAVGLARDGVVSRPPGQLKVRYVPTVVLVDRRGTVHLVQDGVPQGGGAAVIETLKSLVQTR